VAGERELRALVGERAHGFVLATYAAAWAGASSNQIGDMLELAIRLYGDVSVYAAIIEVGALVHEEMGDMGVPVEA